MSTSPKSFRPEEQAMSPHSPVDASARRVFFMRVLGGAVLIGAGAGVAPVQAAEKLSPTDPYARSMGFRLLTEEVDQTKYPRHTNEQHCQSCQLWNGADKEFGNCSFFDGAITPKTGWCKNFKPKKATPA
jgi:hypothetical protein